MTDTQTRPTTQEFIQMLRQKRQQPITQAPSQNPPTPTPVFSSQVPDDVSESDLNLTPAQREEKRRRTAFEESEMFPGQFVPVPEEDILEWTVASRPYKPRDKQYYVTIALIVFLLSLILFFAGQFLPIAVVISVGFLAYVLSAVPPTDIKIKITTWGIRLENDIYYWEQLGRFWFETKYKQRILNCETIRFPGRITFLLGEKTEEELTAILSQVLLKQKPEPTTFDKAADWLQKKLPIDKIEI